jgi:DNA repair protein RecO (recombination protein O)
VRSFTTEALLVRQVAYGDSDVIATLFTEAEGKLGAMVRGGRKSTKRVGGALEPFHTIEARLEDRGGALATLREARIVRVRAGVVGSLEAIDAAGMALRWVRHACPARTREPEAWETAIAILDALDECVAKGVSPRVVLAEGALRLLGDVGWALDLERCVRCGKECPEAKGGRVDPARGGLVCSECGGARVPVSAELRGKVIAAQRRGFAGARRAGAATAASEEVAMTENEAERVLAIVDAAMAAHAGFDR